MARRFEIIEGADNLNRIRDSWETLSAQNSQSRYFHAYSWYRAFAKNLESKPDSLVCVLVYQDDDLEAIFPLQFRKHGFLGLALGVLQAPQHAHMNLHDIVLAEHQNHDGLLYELVQFLKKQKPYKCDAVKLGNVLENSATLKLLREDSRLSTTIFPSGHCDSVPALASEDLPKFVSRNLKGNLRKARSNLSKHDSVEYLATRDPQLLADYLARFFDVEASGWKGENGSGSAIKLNDTLRGFYSDLAEGFGRDHKCEISLLKIDGQVAAGQFGLIAGQTMYLLKIGYSEHFARCAPGNSLLAHTLDRLNAEGEIKAVDLVTDAAWHRSWRPEQQQVYKCCVYSDRLTARLLLAYGCVRQTAKRLYDDLKGRGQRAPQTR
jgi:CelD/BcsL family acetyltransferase involved in cellulose biosynthesis